MADWLRRPEYSYLLSFLEEAEQDAIAVCVSTHEHLAIVRAQTEVRMLSYFTSGSIAEALKKELNGRTRN